MLPSDIDEIAGRIQAAAALFAGKTILLTGGRGFLGRYFTKALLKLNETALKPACELIVLDSLITGLDTATARIEAQGEPLQPTPLGDF